jgi:hypothetical protein
MNKAFNRHGKAAKNIGFNNSDNHNKYCEFSHYTNAQECMDLRENSFSAREMLPFSITSSLERRTSGFSGMPACSHSVITPVKIIR